MPHFLVEYRELGNAAAREALRGDHLAFRMGLGNALALSGPLLGDDDRPVGSVVIVEADSEDDARVIANADPYVAGAVLDCVSVRKYRIAAMKPPAS